MLLCDYIMKLDKDSQVLFEYCYYGKNSQLIPDEELSFRGSRDDFLAFIRANDMLSHLYACSGECNDFAVISEGGNITLRFIDFR